MHHCITQIYCMVKLYTPLHTVVFIFKKQFLWCTFLVAASFSLQINLHAQCTPPPAPVVVPNPAVFCLNNGPIKLEVQPTAPTGQFCSGQVNIAVPDNNVAGAFNAITVAGIPGICMVSDMSVTINMSHTRMGDMVFALKSPNGQIINLDYRLSSTGSNNTSAGFTNTVISSTGTAALSTGTNPWTGTFRADLAGVSANPPAGPTGFTPTATSWSSLYTAAMANGNWTLAFYDAATGETGTLHSWCLNFTYSCPNVPVAAPAVWSPATGLYLDPACTIPYVPGTQTDIVYARPTPQGIYTYQVTHNSLTTPPCTSAATMVTVISGVLNTITTQPADQKVCMGNNAQFSVVATGTGLTYQWQVSTNGGTTYNNLINGGPYSGVTSAALNITQPSITMSGLRYRVLINGNNACAVTLSNPATLTVNQKPSISFYATPYHLLIPGLTTTLKAVTTPPNVAAANGYTWLYNGAAVPGANTDTLLVDFAHIGLYQASVTDTNGCNAVSDTMSVRDSALGIILLYPNPSGGRFQVQLYSTPGTSQPRVLTVYNSMGNKVVALNYDQTKPYQQIFIDIRKNGKGIYWVEVADKNGKRINLTRVLIQ